jgi:integrase
MGHKEESSGRNKFVDTNQHIGYYQLMPKKASYGLGSVYQKTIKDPVTGKDVKSARWHIRYYVDGVNHRVATGTTDRREAQQQLKILIGQAASGQVPVLKVSLVTVNTLLNDLLADYKRNNPKSVECFANGVVTRLLKAFGSHRASKITDISLKAFVDDCLGQGLAPATVNRHMALLRRAFKLGEDHQPRKVAAGTAPNFAKHFLTEDNARRGFFEHADFLKMRDSLHGSVRAALIFGYYSGCRRSEILNLRWGQVDWQGRIVRLLSGETKSNDGRCLPIGGELAAMLAEQKAGCPEGCPWVFYRENGDRVTTIAKAWGLACQETGIERLFHDLRRTAVRNMIRAGVKDTIAMSISGHKTRSVFDRYNVVDEKDLHDAAAAYSAYVGGQGLRICIQCGHETSSAAKFCPECGEKTIG